MIFLGIEETLHIAEKDVTRRRKPGKIGTWFDRTENLNKPDGEEYWEESPLVVDRLQGLSCVSVRKILKPSTVLGDSTVPVNDVFRTILERFLMLNIYSTDESVQELAFRIWIGDK